MLLPAGAAAALFNTGDCRIFHAGTKSRRSIELRSRYSQQGAVHEHMAAAIIYVLVATAVAVAAIASRIRLHWAVSIAMFALLFDIGFALVWALSGQTMEDAIRLITRPNG